MQTAEHGSGLCFEWCGHVMVRSVAGARVSLPRKATALLAYLLIEAGPHSRTHLSTLLWSESDETHAAMSLRQALSRLRDVLGDSLVADRQQVFLQRQEMPLADACDVHRFESLVSTDALAACQVDVHRFFEALLIDDAPDFVHWCDRTRSRLTRTAVQALSRLAQERRAQSDWRAVLQAAERWLDFDPLSTDAACAAIEAAFLCRDSLRALSHRDGYVRLLDREGLGRSAGAARVAELVQRYESVNGHSPATGVPAVKKTNGHCVPIVEASVCTDGALQEREEAWRTMLARFEDVRRDAASRWVTLSGGVGAGRSRLMRDTLTLLVQRGAIVMKTEAPAATPRVPYGVVTQLIRAVLHEDALAGIDEAHLRTLHTLVPELADSFASLRRGVALANVADGTFAVRLQEALVQVFLAMAENGPLVVGLDDAMWYDRESAAALQAVWQRTAGIGVLWLVTDADDVLQERENGAWADLVRAGEKVTLPPLTVGAVERLLVELSGVPDGWLPLAQRVHDGSHGVAGSVLAVVRALYASWGAPDQSWQRRTLGEVPIAPLPARARACIETFDDVTRTVLLSLALVMEPGHPVALPAWERRPFLSLDDLSHVHGISRLRAAVIGQRLVEAQLASEGAGGFRCASPMVAAHCLGMGSALVRDEVRRLVQHRLAGTRGA